MIIGLLGGISFKGIPYLAQTDSSFETPWQLFDENTVEVGKSLLHIAL